MGRIRRTFAWILILGGGFILLSLALNLAIERPKGSKPLELKALLAAGFMLGVCPIFLGSMLRREAPPRAKLPEHDATIPPTVSLAAAPVPLAVAATPADPNAVVCLVTLTQQDLVHFQYWLYRQRLWRLAVVFTAMLVVATVINVVQNGGTVRLTVLFPFVLLIVGTLAVSPYWAGRSQFRRSTAIRQVVRYEFSHAGLRMCTNDSDTTCGWTTVPEAHESQHAVLLMAQPNLYRIVPKSAFTANDLPRFRQLLSEQLGDRWHPLTTSPAHPT